MTRGPNGLCQKGALGLCLRGGVDEGNAQGFQQRFDVRLEHQEGPKGMGRATEAGKMRRCWENMRIYDRNMMGR